MSSAADIDAARAKSRTGVVIHDYPKPSFKTAIPASKGDIVDILDDKDADWTLCVLVKSGAKGFIPASFIERSINAREAYSHGSPTVLRYRCVGPATVRTGMDKLSKKVGRLEPGEVIVVMQTLDFDGFPRVRFSRGWVGIRTKKGHVKLVNAEQQVEKFVKTKTFMPGVSLGHNIITEEGANNLFDDEEERAHQWLGLQGCTPEVSAQICRDLHVKGIKPSVLVSHLGGLPSGALHSLIATTSHAVSQVKVVDARLEAASNLMVKGDYGDALKVYEEILGGNALNGEAKRGVSEAQKGLRFLAIAEGASMDGMDSLMSSPTLLQGGGHADGEGGRLDAIEAMGAIDNAARKEAKDSQSKRELRLREQQHEQAIAGYNQTFGPAPQPASTTAVNILLERNSPRASETAPASETAGQSVPVDLLAGMTLVHPPTPAVDATAQPVGNSALSVLQAFQATSGGGGGAASGTVALLAGSPDTGGVFKPSPYSSPQPTSSQ